MKWADIPTAAKMTVAGVTVCMAVVTFLFTTFETAAGAESWRTQHQQAITCRTVADLRAQIRGLMERLQFDMSLTPSQREWLKQEIHNIQNEIARLDPYGRC